MRDKKRGPKKRGEKVREGRSRGIEEGKKAGRRRRREQRMESGGCCNAMTYVICLKKIRKRIHR